MSTKGSWVVAALVALAALAGARPASGHQIRTAVLALKEIAPGRFAVHWSPPNDGVGSFGDAKPHFPAQCREESVGLVDCGPKGLAGTIRFDSSAAFSGVSVDIEWLRGRRELRFASGDPAVLSVSGTPSQASWRELAVLASGYGAMGVKHILSGADHLMFIAGLMLFVGSLRRLLFTITSFTLAHSLTLAASALSIVHPPQAPVELCIALSILLLAVEATRQHPTWTHRAPWIVAFVFGLLHGFGFAAALAEVGLPPQHLPLALASFNIGVEAGQLVTVAALAACAWLLRRSGWMAERAKTLAVTALGTASVYWCFERAVAWLQK
ncbi:MAG TPA: HupE/UreJ family protein [Polyangiaceae bacterium]|jgi:hypothetical protein|nr:HupE/UreJ family protein [Polyangiaceae bacterium]